MAIHTAPGEATDTLAPLQANQMTEPETTARRAQIQQDVQQDAHGEGAVAKATEPQTEASQCIQSTLASSMLPSTPSPPMTPGQPSAQRHGRNQGTAGADNELTEASERDRAVRDKGARPSTKSLSETGQGTRCTLASSAPPTVPSSTPTITGQPTGARTAPLESSQEAGRAQAERPAPDPDVQGETPLMSSESPLETGQGTHRIPASAAQPTSPSSALTTTTATHQQGAHEAGAVAKATESRSETGWCAYGTPASSERQMTSSSPTPPSQPSAQTRRHGKGTEAVPATLAGEPTHEAQWAREQDAHDDGATASTGSIAETSQGARGTRPSPAQPTPPSSAPTATTTTASSETGRCTQGTPASSNLQTTSPPPTTPSQYPMKTPGPCWVRATDGLAPPSPPRATTRMCSGIWCTTEPAQGEPWSPRQWHEWTAQTHAAPDSPPAQEQEDAGATHMMTVPREAEGQPKSADIEQPGVSRTTNRRDMPQVRPHENRKRDREATAATPAADDGEAEETRSAKKRSRDRTDDREMTPAPVPSDSDMDVVQQAIAATSKDERWTQALGFAMGAVLAHPQESQPTQLADSDDEPSPADALLREIPPSKISKTEGVGRRTRPATPQQARSQQELHDKWREVSMVHRQQRRAHSQAQPRGTNPTLAAGSSTDIALPTEETLHEQLDTRFTVDTLPWGQSTSATHFAPAKKERDPNERWTLYFGNLPASLLLKMNETPWTDPVNIARRLRVGHMVDPEDADYVFTVTHAAPDSLRTPGCPQQQGTPPHEGTPADQYGDRTARRKMENLRRAPQAKGAIPLTDTGCAPPSLGVWLLLRCNSSRYQKVYPGAKIIETVPEYEGLVAEHRRQEEARNQLRAPPPPMPEPVTATCWDRKLYLDKTFAENGITDGAKIVIKRHARTYPSWINRSDGRHDQKRTWPRVVDDAAAAGFFPDGGLNNQNIPQPAGAGTLWIGKVRGDNSLWQMISMANLTAEEAIARIAISTLIDPPGTMIVVRRARTREPEAQTTSNETTTCSSPDTAEATADSNMPLQTAGAGTGAAKNAWNQRQLQHVSPLMLPPPPTIEAPSMRHRGGEDTRGTGRVRHGHKERGSRPRRGGAATSKGGGSSTSNKSRTHTGALSSCWRDKICTHGGPAARPH